MGVDAFSATNFDYDGDKLIHERASGGAILRRYVYGPGDDNPLVWYEGAGTTTRNWLHADERGSVVAVTNSAGSATAINSYDEYGIPASTNIGRFQYTGQTWLPELGLYYYKARIYSPTLGRFMQTDPIGYEDGINWYDYVGGDPVNKTDPTGLALGDRYRTRDEAGSQAIRDINGTSIQGRKEYAGRLYGNSDDSFSYTYPREGDYKNSDAGGIPWGTKAEGDYHTHGSADSRYNDENFSRDDKTENERQQKPGYLGTPTGEIKKFDPNSPDNPKTPTDERQSTIGNTGDGTRIKPIPVPIHRPPSDYEICVMHGSCK